MKINKKGKGRKKGKAGEGQAAEERTCSCSTVHVCLRLYPYILIGAAGSVRVNRSQELRFLKIYGPLAKPNKFEESYEMFRETYKKDASTNRDSSV